jgi:hypothetical protein
MYDEPPTTDQQESTGVSLDELGFGQCRYVVSKDVSPAIYCGKPAEGAEAGAQSIGRA